METEFNLEDQDEQTLVKLMTHPNLQFGEYKLIFSIFELREPSLVLVLNHTHVEKDPSFLRISMEPLLSMLEKEGSAYAFSQFKTLFENDVNQEFGGYRRKKVKTGSLKRLIVGTLALSLCYERMVKVMNLSSTEEGSKATTTEEIEGLAPYFSLETREQYEADYPALKNILQVVEEQIPEYKLSLISKHLKFVEKHYYKSILGYMYLKSASQEANESTVD